MQGCWIVAKAVSRRERWAQDNIEAQGCVTYCPRSYCERTRKIAPLFLGYVFVRIEDGRWSHIDNTFGVINVIKTSEGPATIPDSIIDEIRSRENRNGYVVFPAQERFERGTKVRVKEGPMSGIFGIYQWQSASERARVLFDLMGRKINTTVELSVLEAA